MKTKRVPLRAHAETARWAKALGHPARVAILQFLAARKTCFCGQIVDELPLAQSTVSQHLQELKDAGLIQGTIDGTRVCYCLNQKAIARAQAAFGTLFAGLAPCDARGPCKCE